MTELFQRPIALIDINQLPDDQLKQQQWIGIVARALKQIRAGDSSRISSTCYTTVKDWAITASSD
ncbi:Rpn family recombination-promoting nuclease/putative transposase [Oceanobacter antarcticus]|uniref:Rpn family recombination-promoting nuclease/putative transposase n=1 Tax=Oceanobacter antarcticus TaxID=3133425 RepID=A0ABW8NK05_9GAMM